MVSRAICVAEMVVWGGIISLCLYLSEEEIERRRREEEMGVSGEEALC
jgi:hypothetical protein